MVPRSAVGGRRTAGEAVRAGGIPHQVDRVVGLATRRNAPAQERFPLAAGTPGLPDDERPDPLNPEITVRTRLTLTATLATALLLTSCGGGSDDAAGAGASGGSSGEALRVATEGTYAPFSFHDPANGNELTGYDVEVARAVGEKLGREVEFSETQFDAIFAGLEAGRIDFIANQIGVNPERQAKYLFSTPYTYSNGVVITRADDTSVSSLADVAGKRSAQSTTSNFAEVATGAGAQIEAVEGFTQAITLLKQSRVDVTINDSLAFLEYQKTTGDQDVKVAAEIDDPSESAFAFAQDSTELQTEVDGALEELRTDGTLAQISEKYFGEDVSTGDSEVEEAQQPTVQASAWDLVRDTAAPMAVATLKATIPLTAISFVVGLAIALVVALMRLSSVAVVSQLARTYISLIPAPRCWCSCS